MMEQPTQSIIVDVSSLRPRHLNSSEELNWDFGRFTKEQIDKHYKRYGAGERHLAGDPFFDESFFLTHNNIAYSNSPYKIYLNDIRLLKSKTVEELLSDVPICNKDFILVSHDNKINGSTHSLYVLADFLKNKGYDILILDVDKNNEDLYHKYNLTAADFLFYYNDPTILYWACNKITSSKIIVNSISMAIAEAVRWLDRSKLCLFSREVKPDYLRHSCYEPDVVITQSISDSYATNPIVQTPICPYFLQQKIYEWYEEPVFVEGLDTTKITIGMCGTLTRIKNYHIFLQVAKHLTSYNFIWIGGENLDTNLPNVFHIKSTTNPFMYYKLLDYFVLFSEREPFGNVVLENLLLNKKVLTFMKNIYFDFKHELTKDNYFEFDGNITVQNAIDHITTTATTKQTNVEYKNSSSNAYVIEHFSEYGLEFLDAIKLPTVHLNKINNITDTKNIKVRCPMGFSNQLRLMMAGSYLVTNEFIDSYTQEWILNDENNVNYLSYFEPLPGVNLEVIREGVSVKYNNVINTTCFSKMVHFFTDNKIKRNDAFQTVAPFLKLKKEINILLDGFSKKFDIQNSIGLHLRETDKVEMYPTKNISRSIEDVISICGEYEQVYLATDNPQTQDLIKYHFKEKLVTYSNIPGTPSFNSLRYTTPDHTIADFILLQKCQKFVGTNMSSFSTLIKYLRNTPNDEEFDLNL